MEAFQSVGKLKKIWVSSEIQAFMITSLTIQVVLTFLTPLRKRCASGIFSFGVWLLYLGADAVALYTIGLISSRQTGSSPKTELLPFWAPFLVLHLGGPDTITALALEDNELWHRHVLQFVTQVGATLYVFINSFHNNQLWVPTIFMLVDGCIKYGERICALYFASADAFREAVGIEPDSGPSYAWLMEEYYAATNAHIPASLQRKDVSSEAISLSEGNNIVDHQEPSSHGHEESDGIVVDVSDDGLIDQGNTNSNTSQVSETNDMIVDAYRFYEKFKGILAEGFLTSEDRNSSRNFFLNKPSLEALRIIEIELNLIYDVLYTKAILLQRKRAYLRVLSLLSVTIALVLFTHQNKGNYETCDIIITFALLVGAITLDVCASLMFLLSDWWVILSRGGKTVFLQLNWLRSLYSCWKCYSHNRWSRAIPQYNLLKRFYKDRPSLLKLFFVKRIKDALIECLYVDCVELDDKHVKIIVDELKLKAELVPDHPDAIKEVCAGRGNLVLQDEYSLISEYLQPWTTGIDYDESLLTWHFATDICYFGAEHNVAADDAQEEYRELGRILSDYMSYLFLTKQAMVSPVVGKSDLLFLDTSAEAKRFIRTKMLDYPLSAGVVSKGLRIIKKKMFRAQKEVGFGSDRFLEQFCRRVAETYVRPMVDKGDRSKFVLFNARRLAQQLNMLGEKQWIIICKVWIEMLCYAATRCTPRSHMAELNRGGQLITLVWLLMAHLGLGDCFLQNQGLRWTKLVVPK